MIGRCTVLGLQTAWLYLNDGLDVGGTLDPAKQTLKGVHDTRPGYPMLLVRPGEVALLPKNRFLQGALKGGVQHGFVEQDIVAVRSSPADVIRAPSPNELMAAREGVSDHGDAGAYREVISN